MIPITLKVYPSMKHDSFSRWNTVYISNGLCVDGSDSELLVSIYHELHHIEHKGGITFEILSLTISYLLLSLFIPWLHVLLLLPVYYGLLCYLVRRWEFLADLYALECSDIRSMYSFLDGVDHEGFMGEVFFFFRLHPSRYHRKIKLYIYNLNMWCIKDR